MLLINYYIIRFKNWGGKNPRRTAEDLAFAVARFFQTGGSFQNYYMVSFVVDINTI